VDVPVSELLERLSADERAGVVRLDGDGDRLW
jgi:2-amino-4-hydroxy-6-hydroxymethyldihydropteridine diphosphokinase